MNKDIQLYVIEGDCGRFDYEKELFIYLVRVPAEKPKQLP